MDEETGETNMKLAVSEYCYDWQKHNRHCGLYCEANIVYICHCVAL